MKLKSAHLPKKHLGQNFLNDQRIQQKIVDASMLNANDVVVEIGPGQGAITRRIAPQIKNLYCIEKDQDLIVHLQSEFQDGNVSIHHADFLKWDISSVPGVIKVIGNIPYNISTPIIERLIEHRSKIAQAYLTVQLEFGERLAAPSGSKVYGALSCFVQYHAEVKVLFKIKNTCFSPAPKVDSCFVSLDFAKQPLFCPKDEALLFRIIRGAFSQRRKTILNSLSSIIEKDRLLPVLERLGISPKARAEELNLNNFVDISNGLV